MENDAWKTKYSGLTLLEVRARRQRERRRRHTVVAVAASIAALFAAGYTRIASPGSVARPPVLAHAEQRHSQATPAPEVAVATTPVPPPPAASEESPPATDGFAVQVAAVPDLHEAQGMIARLRASGYPAYVTRTVVNQVELYRVRVGPLKTRRDTEEVASRLDREGFGTPWIAK